MPASPKIDRETRERALALARRNLAGITRLEDEEITIDAERDPDSGWMSDDQFARARRGRPPVAA